MRRSVGSPAAEPESPELLTGLGGPKLAGLLGVLLAAAVSLQGCQVVVPRHYIGNWQSRPSYLAQYAYVPPEAGAPLRLNSCADEGLAPQLKCSGHGHCEDWLEPLPVGANNSLEGLLFCECDRDWTGPECNIERLSQLTAFLLSMCLGIFGVDQFYLGWWAFGALKLCTLGGGGLWWLYDIVRIGSSPVKTSQRFRVAADVPHWAFVLMLLFFTGFMGFSLSIWSINRQRAKRAEQIMLLRMEVPSFFGSAPSSQASQRPITMCGF